MRAQITKTISTVIQLGETVNAHTDAICLDTSKRQYKMNNERRFLIPDCYRFRSSKHNTSEESATSDTLAPNLSLRENIRQSN
jgi:hypothetical protein